MDILNDEKMTPILDREIILRVCFSTWRRKTKLRKEVAESRRMRMEQREKLDNLVNAIRTYKKEKQTVTEIKFPKLERVENSFKNRFEAQRSAIEKLTLKLDEKDRLIEELKLGILDKDALASLNQSKIEIREIFADCSTKVRIKIAPPVDFSHKFMVSTQKAPKILQEMEEKAMERAKRREIIMERKRTIEENRRRMVMEALENKRLQDEEEKRRSLEMIKERRRKELELQKIRQAKKIVFLDKLKKAEDFRRRKLLRRGLTRLKLNNEQSKRNHKMSVLHLRMTTLRKAFQKWQTLIDEKYKEKNALADAFYAGTILTKTLKIWIQAHFESVRAMQVAEDFYDLLLLNNTFVHWHRYVCRQIMKREKLMKLAQQHYKRRTLFHCFYQWRTLPAVLQLEKSKELKLRRWREKVWEVLPDYKPPRDDYI